MKNFLQRFRMHLELIVEGHILNPLWVSHDERRKRRRDAIVKAKMKYLRLYKGYVEGITAITLPNDYSEEERMFTLWLQGEHNAPPLVKSCIRSMRKHVDIPLVVLDEKTLFDWITLPEHIMNKWRNGLITRTHFSDICRIELLYEHGGVWADSTDFFTSSIPKEIMNLDFFMFMAGSNIKLGGTHAFIQSCFMRIKKGNPLLGMWRKLLFEYWEKENSLLDYFTLHFLFRFLVENNEEAADLFSRMPKISQDPTHVLFCELKDNAYSPQLYKRVTEKTFFQKTTYKDSSARIPKKGSIAEFILSQ